MKATCHASTDANVFKYVFELEGPRPAVTEAVLYRYPDFDTRTVLCCSTMSGCPVGCRFCGSGDYFVRALTAEEIVAQVVWAFVDKGVNPLTCQKLQIMFMSMGEPLLNPAGVQGAVRELHKRYPRAQLLLSTMAPQVSYAWVEELSKEIPTVGLQFSVHESTDDARNRLIPFKAKLTLSQIADQGARWAAACADGRRPFFNYCAHKGNSTPEDAERIAQTFPPELWNATVSVVCERDETVAVAHDRQRAVADTFAGLLLARGYNVRTFDPAGQDDIGGGCGQLRYVQNWFRQHPKQARPSVGHGKQPVHATLEEQP